MKRIITIFGALLLLCSTASAQDYPIVSKNGVGSIKMGQHYSKVPASLPPIYTTQFSRMHDMIDAYEVVCSDANDNVTLWIICNDQKDNGEKLYHFTLHSNKARTEKGLSLDSTAEEICKAGGKEVVYKDPYGGSDLCYIELDGLYFFFADTNVLPAKKEKPVFISNTSHPF